MNYADLAPIVAVDVMGAPQPLVIRKIAEAANEFFRLTRAYEVDRTPATVSANTQTITLVPPTGTAFVEVNMVKLGPKKLVPRTRRQLDEDEYEWEVRTGTPDFYSAVGGTIRLVPYPIVSAPELLRVNYSVSPLLTAQSVADEPGLAYQDALIAGAKARLLAMPKKSWADLASAGVFQAEYMKRVNEVRIQVRNGGSSEQQMRVRSRFI
jgi:hypothetical protein